MRKTLLLAAGVLLAGCMAATRQSETAAAPATALPIDISAGADCYTVDLFTEVKVEKPGPEVPERFRRFAGFWGSGAWNGVWCHDLLVSKVYPDGRVELVDMHAPYEPWHQPASAFRRTARIGEDGVLRFEYDGEKVAYRYVDGRLYATRLGRLGTLRAVLRLRGVPPVPMPRPEAVAGGPTTPATPAASAVITGPAGVTGTPLAPVPKVKPRHPAAQPAWRTGD